MAPMTVPPMRIGMLRCECIPVRRKYSASPAASGGRSSAGFCTAKISPARSLATNQESCDGKGAVLLKFGKRAAIEPQKLSKQRLRHLNFELHLFGGHVGKSGGEVSEHA